MSYAVAEALQSAVYGRLAGDAALGALVGTAIYDSLPAGTLPGLYVTLGPESVRDRSDQSGGGARHDLTISVLSEAGGFAAAKAAAAAVNDALSAGPLALSRGRVVTLGFARAKALRVEGGTMRRIDLTFRVRTQDDT